MNSAQEFIKLVIAVLKKRIAKCECGGSGQKPTQTSGGAFTGPMSASYPCPTCAKWRDMLAVTCWHEFKSTWGFEKCHNCNKLLAVSPANPTFAHVEDIKDVLVKLELWERFVKWHVWQTCTVQERYYTSFMSYLLGGQASVKILTTPSLLRKAVISFLREVLGWINHKGK